MSKIFDESFKNIKIQADHYLQSIQLLWKDTIKLTLLEDKQFLKRYETQYYWMMLKPIKGNDKQVQSIKVSVSNNTFLQYSEQTKKMLPCQLEYHHGVIIQSFEDYQQKLKKYQQIIARLNQIRQNISYQDHKITINQKLNQILINSFSIVYNWKQPKSKYRILIMVKGEEYKDLNYFIYHEEQKSLEAITSSVKPLSSSKESSLLTINYMVELIKIHHIKRRNIGLIEKLKNNFKNKINQSFIKQFKDYLKQKQLKKKQFFEDKNKMKLFRDYQYHQTKKFIQKWKLITKSAKTNLFIQIFQIWISKSNIPISVKLQVDGKEKKYEYRFFNNDYLVYTVGQQNQQNFYKINLQNVRAFKNIEFEVEVRLKNSSVCRFNGDHTVYVLQQRQHIFVQQLVLQNRVGKKEVQQDTHCIIYFKTLFSKSMNIRSLRQYFETAIFKNTGVIPTKYSSTFRLDYNPNTYKIIRSLLNNENYAMKLSKYTFQKTYFELVRLIQRQQNQSQRDIIFMDVNQRNNRFPMRFRYEIYSKKLIQVVGYYSKQQDFQSYFDKNYSQYSRNILSQNNIGISKIQYKNLNEDFKLYKPRNYQFIKNEIIKFIYFSNKIKKLQCFPYKLRYSSHLIPIFDSLFQMYLNSRQNDLGVSSLHKLQSYTNYLFTFIAFFAKLYPYSDYNNLKSDLYILRYLVQKRLPNFNDYLNRSNIGLENFIAQHLLHFFTGLPSQLTYRIWDFLISSQRPDQARIIIAFTLLTYFETTQMLPIIPINQFMQRVQINLTKISVDKQFGVKFEKIANKYFEFEQIKQNRFLKHIKGSGQNSIIEDRILKKIILGEVKQKIPYQQQGKIPITKTKQYQKQNILTIKQLNYPLPQPNYHGHTIIQIIIFIHDLTILENINLNLSKFWLKFYIPNTQWKQYIQIQQKNYFYNKSFKIPSNYINFFRAAQSRDKKIITQTLIKIDIVSNINQPAKSQRQKIQLKGFFDFSLYEKDKAYKIAITLSPENLHNKGRTVLNISFCLKSHIYNSHPTAKKDSKSLELLCQKLLDYDIDESNQCIVANNILLCNLQKIKYPLDEFSSDQYKRVINKAINEYEIQWLQSSITTIEQLKAIFYNLFNQQKDKTLKHQFSKYYQIFAQQNNMQYVYFAEMIIKFIIHSRISRKKKLMYLYCILTHYQNSYSKKLNVQSVNALIRILYKHHFLINACPYITDSCGKIIQAYYFQSDLKSQEKRDFTEIVQDWAYICNLKYGYSDIILGSSRDLSILRSFFDVKTLKKMEQQKQCRFQIVYEIQGFKHLWSAVVNTKTFQILKRGTKFLNQFASYANIQYLDSTQEFLLNCQNVIPLQIHKNYSYQQFVRLLLSNHLIRYILDLQVSLDGIVKNSEEVMPLKKGFKDVQEQNDEQEKQLSKFSSWALCRGQNCLESWHRCNITKPGKVLSKVIFEFDADHEYNVATLDLISMQQIVLQPDKK